MERHMQAPPIPANESERVQALHAYSVLDTAPELTFDALTRLVAYVLDVPISLVSLVDTDRQWFKARHGLEAPELPRETSFCGHVVATDGPLIVPDARDDPRFFDNPLVTGADRIRFYAGFPLRTPGGFVVGSLCAIDRKPRTIPAERLEVLGALAKQTVDQLELRREHRITSRNAARLDVYRRHFELFPALLATLDERHALADVSAGFASILGWPPAALVGISLVDLAHPEDRAKALEGLVDLTRGRKPSLRNRVRLQHFDGHHVRVLLTARLDDGRTFVQGQELA